MKDSTLTAISDKELWVLSGNRPGGPWTLPLWVYHYECDHQPFVRLSPIQVTVEQAEEIARLFETDAIWTGNGAYLVERSLFEKHATRAHGVTPDYYRHWPGVESGVPVKDQLQIKSWDQPEPDGDTSFIKFLTQKRGISYHLIKLVWWAIREEGAEWMVGQRKPIDLGFVTLYPVPFRSNWKDIMVAKHPTAGHSFRKPAAQRELDLANSGFLADICSGENIAVEPRSHTIHWNIEAVPDKEWEATSQRIESLRLEIGKHKYPDALESTLRRLLPSLLEIMGSYLAKIALPFAAIHRSHRFGWRYLVPSLGPGKVRPKAPAKLACRVVVSDQLISFGAGRSGLDLLPPPPPLPPLPPLPPPTLDLREPPQLPTLDPPPNP